MSLADEIDYARICFYGRYGTGKTTAMASAARLGIVHHIDAEQRLKPGPLRRLGIPVERIIPHREISYEALTKLIWDIKAEIHDHPGDVAAVGIDSMTEAVKLMIGRIIDESVAELAARAKRRGEVLDINPFEVPDNGWNDMTEQFRRLFRLLRDLECHLVFTAHERRTTDEQDGSVSYGPATTPAVQQDLMGYVDILGHTEMSLGFYVARFHPGTKYEAKDAFGVLPHVMAHPTVERIVRYIRGELTIETDPLQQQYQLAIKDASDAIRAAAATKVDPTGAAPRRRRGGGGDIA